MFFTFLAIDGLCIIHIEHSVCTSTCTGSVQSADITNSVDKLHKTAACSNYKLNLENCIFDGHLPQDIPIRAIMCQVNGAFLAYRDIGSKDTTNTVLSVPKHTAEISRVVTAHAHIQTKIKPKAVENNATQPTPEMPTNSAIFNTTSSNTPTKGNIQQIVLCTCGGLLLLCVVTVGLTYMIKKKRGAVAAAARYQLNHDSSDEEDHDVDEQEGGDDNNQHVVTMVPLRHGRPDPRRKSVRIALRNPRRTGRPKKPLKKFEL